MVGYYSPGVLRQHGFDRSGAALAQQRVVYREGYVLRLGAHVDRYGRLLAVVVAGDYPRRAQAVSSHYAVFAYGGDLGCAGRPGDLHVVHIVGIGRKLPEFVYRKYDASALRDRDLGGRGKHI